MNPDALQRWQDQVDDEIARLSTSDEYDDDRTRERLAALNQLSRQLEHARRLIEGNPGEGTLHDMLADAADHVDYEAAVVEAAADDIEDDDIAEAADDQADAMREAADALDEAADAARDTAAEVFTETGIPQDVPKPDDELDDVVAGNPSDGRGTYGTRESQERAAADLRRVIGTIENGDAEPEDWRELDNLITEIVETMQAGDWHQSVQVPLNRAIEIERQHRTVEGNPGEAPQLIPAPSEPPPDATHLVPAEAPPAAPTQAASDSAPESAHWYTKPIGRRG